MVIVNLKSTDGMTTFPVTASLVDKLHWTPLDEPIGNGNATAFWYKPVIQIEFGVIEYTCPLWFCPRSCILDNPSSLMYTGALQYYVIDEDSSIAVEMFGFSNHPWLVISDYKDQ